MSALTVCLGNLVSNRISKLALRCSLTVVLMLFVWRICAFRVKTAVQAALKDAVSRVLTPKKSTDVLREVRHEYSKFSRSCDYRCRTNRLTCHACFGTRSVGEFHCSAVEISCGESSYLVQFQRAPDRAPMLIALI